MILTETMNDAYENKSFVFGGERKFVTARFCDKRIRLKRKAYDGSIAVRNGRTARRLAR
ncbi:MAG: hypothetical protein L6V93_11845 [Clostridiales bacterium]|nr:MAG: hypothetical protein L6V93_11845 [Clostridiales bacterium]